VCIYSLAHVNAFKDCIATRRGRICSFVAAEQRRLKRVMYTASRQRNFVVFIRMRRYRGLDNCCCVVCVLNVELKR